jgi:hypothetical protein
MPHFILRVGPAHEPVPTTPRGTRSWPRGARGAGAVPGWLAGQQHRGFSTNQDFNGDIALILCCGACWTGHMVRRWHADPFGFLRPSNEVPALIASAPPATPPSTGTGVVTFLMG